MIFRNVGVFLLDKFAVFSERLAKFDFGIVVDYYDTCVNRTQMRYEGRPVRFSVSARARPNTFLRHFATPRPRSQAAAAEGQAAVPGVSAARPRPWRPCS